MNGPFAAARSIVDGARHQLLAGAALALHEHGGRAVRHLLHQRHQPAEGGAGPDHVALPQQVVEALLQRPVLGDEIAALEGLPHHLGELGALERLGQEVGGAILHRPDRLFHGAEGGEQDHVHVGRDRLRLPEQLEAGEARHLEVGEHQVHPALPQPLQRGLAVGGEHDRVAFTRQRALQALADGGIVVGHQERRERRPGLSHGPLSGRAPSW